MATRAARGERQIRLSAERAAQVRALARTYQLSDDEVIARALDLLVAAVTALGVSQGVGRPGPRARNEGESDRSSASDTIILPSPEDLAMQDMLAAGLLTEIKPLPTEVVPFTPIEVRGKPLSELVIEERR